jgi:hypothetical protein
MKMIKQVSLSEDHPFLFYKKAAYEVVDTAKIDWLQTSSIPGILPCVGIQDRFIRYDLAGGKPLGQTPAITGSVLYSWLANITETLLEAERAGLDTGCFVMNKNQVFIDPFSNRLVFIYLPVKSNTFEKVSLKEFIQEIITMAPYEETSGAGFFIKLHNYLFSTPSIDPGDLASLLSQWAIQFDLQFESQPGVRTGKSYYSPGPTGRVQDRLPSFAHNPETQAKTGPVVIPEDEGTTVLGLQQEEEDQGTTVLGTMNAPYLLGVSGEKIVLDKPVFKIGRDPHQADYTSNNLVIGRVHALFLTENGEYFFEDNSSRNGSYINGVKAEPKQKIKIRHEDSIKLANEEYIFRLY